MDAIRRFKEQQERKKQEENERKVQEKLSTLEHRANQGDRKAKIVLKQIERSKEEREKEPEVSQKSHKQQNGGNKTARNTSASNNGFAPPKPKPKPIVTDFEELMRLAKQNNNEIRREKTPPPPPAPKAQPIARRKPIERVAGSVAPVTVPSRAYPRDDNVDNLSRNKPKPPLPAPSLSLKEKEEFIRRLAAARGQANANQSSRPLPSQRPIASSSDNHRLPMRPQTSFKDTRMRPQPYPPRGRPMYHQAPPSRYDIDRYRGPQSRYGGYDDYDDEEEDDYEDEYEQDDFVVDDEDEDVQAELSKTIKSVFRYDKRRCDRREEELDRQYRAIGNVNTFEDLEREERRASRLAAAEDARAQREEEERKRLKKMRKEGKA